ncbi:hypothetical protein LWI28_005838 [Acer negundo]|uniref:Vps53 C-terminal domain-containing protein n=1 Tax=Acer negundo TaxID=4023 RepID=A0AAD5J899_ACENE|nr:hypothetical protein LWI28_005838 [Acer negundo]
MNAYIPEASTCGVTEAALAALSLKRNSSKLYQIKLLYCACRMKSYFVHGILTVAGPQFADAVDMSDVQHSCTWKPSFTGLKISLHHLLVHDSMPIFSNADTSETGAQQMLLDTQAIITILLDISNLGRHTTSTASYTKFVTREMSKAKALLKVCD